MSALRAEFFRDDEAGTWHFRVPALHINGGGQDDQEAARVACLDAIAFALEGDPAEYDQDSEALTLDVTVSAHAA